jgi:hypothetical protein
LKNDLRKARLQIRSLKRKLQQNIQNNGIDLDKKMEKDFEIIMKEHHQRVCEEYPNGSFQRLFWESQLHAISQHKNAIRWHPSIIKWCIYLRHKSPRAYEILRATNCIILPSQRTLRDYTYHFNTTAGFSTGLDRQLYNDTLQFKEYEKVFYWVMKCILKRDLCIIK